jgi:uncharacterized membrane protein YfcA
VIFGVVLASSALASLKRQKDHLSPSPDRLATRLNLDGTYPTEQGRAPYHVAHVPLGFGLMFVAGGLSGLLGIGSGALKVLAMDGAMRLPFKVATTTSNFMIGVTAAAGAGIYLSRGYIDPLLACPIMLGAMAGAVIGARLLSVAAVRPLRLLFSAVIFALAGEMIFEGFIGRL